MNYKIVCLNHFQNHFHESKNYVTVQYWVYIDIGCGIYCKYTLRYLSNFIEKILNFDK